MLSECFLNGLKDALISPGHGGNLLDDNDVLVDENGLKALSVSLRLPFLVVPICERWVDGTGGPASALWETFQTQNSCAILRRLVRKPPRH